MSTNIKYLDLDGTQNLSNIGWTWKKNIYLIMSQLNEQGKQNTICYILNRVLISGC